MRVFITFRLFIFALIALFAAGQLQAAEIVIKRGDVVVVPVDGPIAEPQLVFLRRVLKDAESADASAFILDMDTPGGVATVAEDIAELLTKATIPTYTWVNTHAASAGALIALATDHIYMAPISAIGAAALVLSSGEDIPETMLEKATSFNSALFRNVAEENGHNSDLVDAFMDPKKELKIGDDVISPAGSLLTLNASEATKEYDGRPLLAAGIASTLDELKEKAGLQGPTVVVEPSGFETLASWITMAAPLFLLGGIMGAYIEFKTPGFGVAGFISAVCFLIFFTGHYVAGLTGLEVLAVFVLGLALIVLELIFFPGLLVFTMLGVALMLGSVFFAMIDFFPGEPIIPTADMLVRPLINLGFTILLATVLISLIARYLPEAPLFRHIVLAAQSPVGPSIESLSNASGPSVAPGDTGTALSPLRPAGKAQIGPLYLDVVSNGDFIDSGSPIRVVSASRSNIIVESA